MRKSLSSNHTCCMDVLGGQDEGHISSSADVIIHPVIAYINQLIVAESILCCINTHTNSPSFISLPPSPSFFRTISLSLSSSWPCFTMSMSHHVTVSTCQCFASAEWPHDSVALCMPAPILYLGLLNSTVPQSLSALSSNLLRFPFPDALNIMPCSVRSPVPSLPHACLLCLTLLNSPLHVYNAELVPQNVHLPPINYV